MDRTDSAIVESSPVTPKENTPIIPTRVSTRESQRVPDTAENAGNQTRDSAAWISGFTLNELTNVTLQVLGFIIAAVFGAWAIKSYSSANIANELSQHALTQSFFANQLAIMGLCLADQFKSSSECSLVLEAISLPSIIHAVIPTLTTAPGTTIPTSTLPPFSPPPASPSVSLPPITISISTPPATTETLASSSASFPTPSTTTIIIAVPTADNESHRSHVAFGLGGIIGVIVGTTVFIAITGLVFVGRKRARTRSKSTHSSL